MAIQHVWLCAAAIGIPPGFWENFQPTVKVFGCLSYAVSHAGAPYSWAINPKTPPYYEAVAIQHGYLRVEANRTALIMEARFLNGGIPALSYLLFSLL